MSKQFLHISFNWETPPNNEDLKKVFDSALDWIKYTPNCWIVWTSSDPDKWRDRLKPLTNTNDSFFICKLDINIRQGWLTPWIWEWINKER